MFRFEELKVWRKAIGLYDMVDALAGGFTPRAGTILADQMRRAALSGSTNIAEGSGRETLKDFQHFLTIAKGPVFEIVSLATVGRRRAQLSDEHFREIYDCAEEISRMLTALKRPRKI
jgi:four helix bundle protein